MLMNPREKHTAKIVFWCVSPFLFAGLFRLFFLFFYFVYGMLLLWMIGGKYNVPILAAATITSIVFTGATLVILYRQFKWHILDEQRKKEKTR